MDSFFGIGVFELVFIFIFALIFLGPERLPQVMRQVLSFIRQVRSLSSDITTQINQEFGDLGEMDPRKIMNDVTAPVKDELKSTAKSASTPKPKPNPNATPKKTITPQPKTVPAKTQTTKPAANQATSSAVTATDAAPETAPKKVDENTIATETAPIPLSSVASEERSLNGDHSHQEHATPSADSADSGQSIAPPSLQAQRSAPAEAGEAEQPRIVERAAEEGSV